MKKHSGMRPQDIAILLKIATKETQWLMKDLAKELEISASEVSESLNRSVIAGLINQDKHELHKLALLDFLSSGLRYVFPQQPGGIARGIATAHSAPPLNAQIMSDEIFVWPFAKGNKRGQAIVPLYPKLPDACLADPEFYELMALTDALRIGKSREQNLAISMIKERI